MIAITTLLLAIWVDPIGDRPPLTELKALLQSAVTDQQYEEAQRIVDDVIAIGNPAGADVLIEVVLRTDDYGTWTVERYVREQLRTVVGTAWVERLCSRAKEHPDPRVRAALIQILGRRTERRAYVGVLTSLYDAADEVVRAALEALVEKQDSAIVDHLIRALEYREEKGLGHFQKVADLRHALTALTGATLERSVEWKKFWEPRRESFRRGEGAGAVTLTAAGGRFLFGHTRVESHHLVLLLDVSESMAREDPRPADAPSRGRTAVAVDERNSASRSGSRRRIDRARTELIRFISELPDDRSFTVIAFSDSLNVLDWSLIPATPANKRRASEFVETLLCGGETWIDRVLEAAFAIEKASEIVLISDGSPRKFGERMDGESLLRKARHLNRNRFIRLHTVGFQAAGSRMREFLQKLAEQNDGSYVGLE